MKKTVLWSFVLMVGFTACVSALAEDWVSVAEIYGQAQAMGGVWQETFDTKSGKVEISAPIIVPNVETMPVLTLGQMKPIAEERYNELEAQGRSGRRKDAIEYFIEVGGEEQEVFYGNEYTTRLGEVHEGYDAVEFTWVQHGAFRYSVGVGGLERAEPTTFHYGPWELDTEAANLRARTLTIEDAVSLTLKDIAAHFPGETFDIQPAKIVLRGSTLSEKKGKSKEYKRDGFSKISFEQVIDGVPLIGGMFISSYAQRQEVTHVSNEELERLSDLYGVGTNAVFGHGLSGYFATEEDYRTMLNLARKRSVEIEDVPLASLDSILETLGQMIEQGDIGALYSVRLGYILYSDPDMTDYAFAIPRWVAEYVTPKDLTRDREKDARGFDAEPWIHNQEVLIDAQSAEAIIYMIGDETAYSVPDMKTWEEL